MNAEQNLSRILESLYDKTGTPEEWPELLCEVVAYTGGEVGKLIVGELHGDRPWLIAVSNRRPTTSTPSCSATASATRACA